MIQDNEQPKPINDYDLIVVCAENKQEELNHLGDKLAKQLALDYVDLAWSDGNWKNLPLTMFNYDLKYGSQVIQGDKSVLEELPHYPAADIPILEAVMLLLNRTAGLLTGLRGEYFEGKPLTSPEKSYLYNQVVKASVAIGDWFLVNWKCYDVSYRIRRERFSAFGKAHGLPEALLQRVITAYDLKIHPIRGEEFELQDLQGLWKDLKQSLIQSCAAMDNHSLASLDEAMNTFVRALSNRKLIRVDNARYLHHEMLSAVVKSFMADRVNFRALLYSSLPFLLAAVMEGENQKQYFQEALDRVREGFYLPMTNEWNYLNWENLRSKLIHWWFATIH